MGYQEETYSSLKEGAQRGTTTSTDELQASSRARLAGYLGVRPAAELGLLRAARDALAALPEEDLDEESD